MTEQKITDELKEMGYELKKQPNIYDSFDYAIACDGFIVAGEHYPDHEYWMSLQDVQKWIDERKREYNALLENLRES